MKILLRIIFILFIFVYASSVNAAWNINDAVYSSVNITTSPATSAEGMFIKADGTKVYLSNFGNSTIYQFSLGTAWDFSTMTYDNKSKSVASQGTPDDVSLSADGTKMFILSFYDYTVKQYTLGTAWDISTATYDSVSLALGSANHYDFSMKRDGTKLYSLNDYNNRVQQYTLSTPWDLTTAVAGTNYSYGNLNDGQELVFTIGDNGSNMYIGTSNNERIHWYTLSTPWDTSTATYSGSYKSISAQDSSIRKVVFNPAGNKMYAVGQTNQKIFVYDVGGDQIDPTINTLSPSDNATGVSVSANLVINFSEFVDVKTGNVSIYKTSDNSLVEAIDVTSGQVTGSGTDTITINPSVTFAEKTEYYVQISTTAFDDTAGNSFVGITNQTSWSFTTIDTISPIIIQFGATTGNTTATVTWETDEESSSIVDYDISNTYSTSTQETDTSPRVTSHTVLLSNLVPCTTYFFQVRSKDSSLNSVSNQSFFTTTGCSGGATILSSNLGIISNATGGTRQLIDGGGLGINLNISAGTVGSDASFQIKSLNQDTVFLTSGTPSGKAKAGDYTFELKALTNVNTAVTSFNQPIGITMTYEDADITGIRESSLLIYRWDGTTWNTLSNCTVNESANSITCSTLNFSVFSIFGDAIVISSSSPGGAISVEFLQALSDRLRAEINIKNALAQNQLEESSNLNQNKVCPKLDKLDFVLKLKVDNENVKVLQKILNCKGFIVSSIGLGSINNETTFYGNKTKEAVLNFQKENKLKVDGIVGDQTIKFLNS